MKHYVRRSQVETTQTRAHAQVSGRIHNPPDLARHASQTERSSTEVVYHAGRATDALQLFFSRPASCRDARHRTAISTLAPSLEEVRKHTDAQAGILLAEASSAICVQRFDGSRIVQITLRIAFRCVLHRCESQDIHC